MAIDCFKVTTMTPVLTAEEIREQGVHATSAPSECMTALLVRVRGEYVEMPGLRLTIRQAARLFGMLPDVADAVLNELRRASVLALSSDGKYSLIAESSRSRRSASRFCD
jgi:hypothetical protein